MDEQNQLNQPSSPEQLNQQNNPDDELHTGLKVLSFCIPIAGAIIYFSKKETKPNSAKSACHAALWGFGVSMLISIIERLAGV